jgi:phosphate transport system permease protein
MNHSNSEGSVDPEIQLPTLPRSPAFLSEGFVRRRTLKLKIIDVIFENLTFIAALLIPLVLVLIFVCLTQGAWPAIQKFGLKFFTSADWDPVADNFGVLVPVCGTLMTSFLALLIAVPISFGIAIFLTEIAPDFIRRPFGIAIELLAAIPSIIYGMWGLFVFAPFCAKYIQPPIQHAFATVPVIGKLVEGPAIGIGIMTAGIILAVMIVPFISSTIRDSFLVVPTILKESAFALGATKWEVIWKVVLPFSRNGVVGGIILGLARALGETMAVTFVIGNAHNLSSSLFMPGSTISSILANEFTEAIGDIHPAALIELGLVLFVITFIILIAARLLLLKNKKGRA